MRKCLETPDWWMPAFSTTSPTCSSPPRSVSTIRRRVGSASTWKASSSMSVYMHTYAYTVNGQSYACSTSDSPPPCGEELEEGVRAAASPERTPPLPPPQGGGE